MKNDWVQRSNAYLLSESTTQNQISKQIKKKIRAILMALYTKEENSSQSLPKLTWTSSSTLT